MDKNIRNTTKSTSDTRVEKSRIFEDWGWRTGWLIILAFIIIQVYMALLDPSLYHPDEIYQSYEIGHYLYYHYGIRSWEWLYYGGGVYTAPLNLGPIRSLLTPLLFYVLFALGEFLKLNYWTQTLPLIRVFLALNFSLGMIALGLIIREWKSPFMNLSWMIFWVLIILYPDTLVYGSHAFTNTIGLTPLWWGLLLFLWSKKTHKKYKIFSLDLLAGFFVATALWIRPDFILIVIPFVFFFLPYQELGTLFKQPILVFIHQNMNNEPKISHQEKISLRVVLYHYCCAFIKSNTTIILLGFVMGGFVSFLINGTLDLIYWGQFAVSLIHYIQFNSNPANNAIFGTAPTGYYFYELFFKRPTFSWLLVLDILVVASISKKFFSITFWKKTPVERIKKLFWQLWLLVIILVVVLVVWELEPHKELRFILYWEYFFFAFSAYCLSLIIWGIAGFLVQFNKNLPLKLLNKKKLQRLVVIGLLIVITIPFFLGIIVDAKNISWHNFDDVLAAEEYIGQQNNLTGLIIIGAFWYDGGYTYLHRNVSILHIDTPSYNGILNYALMFPPSNYNYLLVPHYKYFYYPILYNLTEYHWTLIKTILGRSDVWIHT